MAYVFDQLNQALQPSSTNIFGTGGAPPPAGGQDQAPQRSGGEAPVTGGQTGGGAPAVQSAGRTQFQASPDQSQALKAPDAAGGGLISDIKSGQTAAAKQADQDAAAYSTTQAQKDTSKSDVSRAGTVLQSPDDANYIASRLTQTNAPKVDDFSPTATRNAALEASKSPGELAGYLQQKGGANYTAGMAGLDRMLIQQDPAFQKARAQGIAAQNDLGPTFAGGFLQQDEQGKLDKSYGAATDAIKANLGGQAQTIVNPAVKAYRDEVAARAGLRTNGDQPYLAQQSQAAIKDFQTQHPELANRVFNIPGVDASKFYSVGADPSVASYMSPQQAAQYHQLADLLALGGGNRLADIGGGGAPGDRESFDRAGFEKALLAGAQNAAPITVGSANDQAQYVPYTGQANDTSGPDPGHLGPLSPETPRNLINDVRSGNGGGVVRDLTVNPVQAQLGADQRITQGLNNALGANPTLKKVTETPITALQKALSPPDQGAVPANLRGQGPNVLPSLAGTAVSPGISDETAADALANGLAVPDLPDDGSAVSDVRAKTNIQPAGYAQVSHMLKGLSPSTYNYKPGLGLPPGPQMGVMAQDLQKSPLGAQAVSHGPGGMKQIDYGKLFPAMTAALASHDQQLRALHAKKKGAV